jgi:hypothetical protein
MKCKPTSYWLPKSPHYPIIVNYSTVVNKGCKLFLKLSLVTELILFGYLVIWLFYGNVSPAEITALASNDL